MDYWYYILRRKVEVFTSKNTIKKLPIKLEEYSDHTILTALEKLKTAWKEYTYKLTKKVVASLQKTFIIEKIAQKSHD